MAKLTTKQHYIPSSYSKRMFADKTTFYFFDRKTDQWSNKNPTNTNAAKRIYNITDKNFLDMGFQKDHVEKYFSKFEGKFWQLYDKNKTVFGPYEIGSWLMKLDLHIYERHPVTLKMMSLDENKPMGARELDVFSSIANNVLGEGFGEIFLKMRYNRKVGGFKAKHLGDISVRYLTILKFKNEMPISNQPRIMVGFFEKGSLPGETVHKVYEDYYNHPAIIQVDSKTWYLFHGDPKMYFSTEKYTEEEIFEDFKKKKLEKAHESIYFEYKECEVSDKWEQRIRYAMVIGGAICNSKNMGIVTSQIVFRGDIAQGPSAIPVVIFKDAPELLFTKGAFNKFIKEMEGFPSKTSYAKHSSDALVNSYQELDKIEEKLFDLD